MRNLLLASATALALACGATAVSGQNSPAPTSTAMTSPQKAAYESWPAEQKAAYDRWPAEYQAYFWSLTANQQKGWFALSDAQRKQVYDMPPASRAAAWTSIEQQLAGAASPSATTGTPADAAAAPPVDNDPASAPTQLQANPMSSEPATDSAPNPPTADSSVAPAMPADPSYNAGPYKGALTAPPADALNKTYPVCTRKLQDNCRNPGEGGAPGRRRSI